MISLTDEKLMALRDAAHSVRSNAYAPYSKHPVGAAILADNGEIFAAPNVENAAYPLGSCAEATAIGMMVGAGARVIKAVAISGPGYHSCTPCGGCRQRLWEFGETDTPIYIYDKDKKQIDSFELKDLLPAAFGKENTDEAQEV